MYYQNYEDYMQSVLGYPVQNSTYQQGNQVQESMNNNDSRMRENIDWYPEIYKIVYPMVCKACDEYQEGEITEDVIDNMTNIVFSNIEVGDIDVTTTQNVRQQPELRNGDVPNPRAKNTLQETRQEVRQQRRPNPLLRDFIRVLILREFFDRRPNRPHHRPPFPGSIRPPYLNQPNVPPPMPNGYPNPYRPMP